MATLRQFIYDELVEITDDFKTEIGQGGSGSVFRGIFGCTAVAVKRVPESPMSATLFARELQSAMIEHPNVVSVIGWCWQPPCSYVISEYAGESLSSMLKSGSLSALQRVCVLYDAAKGLALLHSLPQPIVHRDVNPNNIVVSAAGAKLLDFGLSRIIDLSRVSIATTVVIGTELYVDPMQQFAGVSPACDVFSFGVTTLALLMGQSNGAELKQTVHAFLAANQGTTVKFRKDMSVQWPEKIEEALLEIVRSCIRPFQVDRTHMAKICEILQQLPKQSLGTDDASSCDACSVVIGSLVKRIEELEAQAVQDRYQAEIFQRMFVHMQQQIDMLKSQQSPTAQVTTQMTAPARMTAVPQTAPRGMAGPATPTAVIQRLLRLFVFITNKGFVFDGQRWTAFRNIGISTRLHNRVCKASDDSVYIMDDNWGLFEYTVSTDVMTKRSSDRPRGIQYLARSLVIHKGVLYCFGYTGDARDGTTVFALSSDAKWQKVGSFTGWRGAAAVGVIGDKIYISDEKSTEYYDTTSRRTARLSGTSASEAGFCVYRKKLFVAGGVVPDKLVATFKCYDPFTDNWTQLTSISSVRSNLALVVFNDRLWAIGGLNEGSVLSIVESFDVSTNSWRSEPSLPQPLQGCCACAL
eukprot:TRINITY_DN1096_c0_g1_i10.p1 TRINITY_DN1096_c0_g1~~TRINITY_DN1096_c0_g1_i10.p1  ORF type:complete len:637 (-),score=120.47 TRINITY_DN1096_c0_g1_i10:23-1933(-)